MKLTKKQKDVIFNHIQVSTKVIENNEHIYWDAGEASYNIDMKSIWTKAQQQYLDQRFDNLESSMNTKFDQVNTRIDNLEIKMDQKFDNLESKMNKKIDDRFDAIVTILARNGIK